MPTGAITEYIDVAQLALYVFWVFFAGLIYYLHQESKREGYPLENERSAHVKVQGWPPIPDAKTYKLAHGADVTVPRIGEPKDVVNAKPTGNWPGAPLVPNGDPMKAGVGPGSYAQRPNTPDLTVDGTPRLVPLRADSSFSVAQQDPDPRGMQVVGADGAVGGTCVDLWVDRAEMLFRYLELEVDAGGGKRRVLLPMNFARVEHDKGFYRFAWGRLKEQPAKVLVKSILGRHFADVPPTAQADVVTMLEEEKVMAYYGAGTLYATPQRQEPLL